MITTLRCPWLCLAILLCCCGISLAQEPAGQAEQAPTFKGRTFEEWKRLLPSDLDSETRAEAYRAMNAFGYHFPDEYRQAAIEIIKTNLPKERAYDVQVQGYRSAYMMPPSERTALFIAGLRSDQRSAALLKLGGSSPIMTTEFATEELADAIIEILNADQKIVLENKVNIRSEAVNALRSIVTASEWKPDRSNKEGKYKRIRPEGEYGPITKKALPIMEKLLNDEDPAVRKAALGLIQGFDPEIAVKKLAEQLEALVEGGKIVTNDFTRRRRGMSDDEQTAKEILRYLSYYGPKAKQAVPMLQKIERDHPELMPVLRSSIRATLKAIEEPAK